jgi:hypothetical protein
VSHHAGQQRKEAGEKGCSSSTRPWESRSPAPPVAATDIWLESRTYVPARGTDGENTHALLYEYLTFDAEDIVQPGVYLRVGGPGRPGRRAKKRLQ